MGSDDTQGPGETAGAGGSDASAGHGGTGATGQGGSGASGGHGGGGGVAGQGGIGGGAGQGAAAVALRAKEVSAAALDRGAAAVLQGKAEVGALRVKEVSAAGAAKAAAAVTRERVALAAPVAAKAAAVVTRGRVARVAPRALGARVAPRALGVRVAPAAGAALRAQRPAMRYSRRWLRHRSPPRTSMRAGTCRREQTRRGLQSTKRMSRTAGLRLRKGRRRTSRDTEG